MEKLIEAIMDKIEYEMSRLYWNNNQERMNSPFQNTGEVYQNDTFTVRAYYWGDDEYVSKLPNFEYKNFKCWWYKHSHRGLYWSYYDDDIPTSFLTTMLDECYKSLEHDFKINKKGGFQYENQI